MLSKEEIENLMYKNEYIQQPVTLLTNENLAALELHCKKTIQRERGFRQEEHLIILELLYEYRHLEEQEQKLIEKLEEDIEYGEKFKSHLEPTIPEIRAEYAQEILEILKGEKDEKKQK